MEKMAHAKSECCSFATHLARGRWTSVFCSFLIMAVGGASYLFAIYSGDIKKNLGYNQTMLNTISSWKDIGTSTGVLPGLVAEVTPIWFLLVVGSVTNLAGYLMIWLAVTGKIAKPQLWHMCAYMFMAAHSVNFTNTGSIVTCVKNFPESRSAMLGLLKGYVGLSGSILTQVYSALYGDDSTSLILLTAWLPSLIALLVVNTIREKEVQLRQPNEIKVFYHFLYMSAALAVFLMAMTMIQHHVVFSQAGYAGSAAAACVLLFLPAVVVVRQEEFLWKQMKAPPARILVEKLQAVEQNQNSSANEAAEEIKTSFFANIFSKPKRGEDYSILQALLSIDMLIIFFSTIVGLGSCLTALDNMGQIGEALLYEPKTIKTFISLISIWNYAGRVFSGFLSQILFMRYKISRPLMLSAVLFLACIGHLLIAFPFKGSIYLASLIIGFTLGAQVPLLLTIISEIFGLKHYATLFNCGQMGSPIGSFFLNRELTGRIYDIEAIKLHEIEGLVHQQLGKPLVCKGKQCFGSSFKIMASATFFSAIILLVLAARTREFYQGDLYRRYKGETCVKHSDDKKETQMASSSANVPK